MRGDPLIALALAVSSAVAPAARAGHRDDDGDDGGPRSRCRAVQASFRCARGDDDQGPRGSCPLDVRAFGATGDGTTDDTAAIQCALDFASDAARFPTGAAVYLPAGTYRIALPKDSGPADPALTIAASGVRLYGDGPASVLSVGQWATTTLAQPAAFLLVASSSGPLADVRVEQLRFLGPLRRGQVVAPQFPYAAIQFGTRAAGSVIDQSGVRAVEFQGTGTAVRFLGAPAGAPRVSSGNAVTDSRFLDLDGSGVACETTGQVDSLVQRNLFRGLSFTAVAWGGTRALVQDNLFDDLSSAAIFFDQDAAQGGYSIISGNSITNVGNNGTSQPSAAIQLGAVRGASRVVVEQNHIRDAWGKGIWATGGSDHVIRANTVDGFGLAGVAEEGVGIWAANITSSSRVTQNFVRCAGSGAACVFGVVTGGSHSQNSWSDGNVVVGVTAHGGRAFVATSSLGLNGAGRLGMGGAHALNGRNLDLDTGATAPDSDYTNHPSLPILAAAGGVIAGSVGGARAWWIWSGADGTVTSLTDGTIGDTVTLYFSPAPASTTVVNGGAGGPFDLKSDFVTQPQRSAVLVLLCVSTDPQLWVEVSRSNH